MFEVVLVIATCGVMARIAIADERSSILWGLVTLINCIASFGIPLPYLAHPSGLHHVVYRHDGGQSSLRNLIGS
jgi:hypothetical protein